MAIAKGMDLALGIIMLVLGILVVTGNLTLGPIVWVAAIILIIVGVLMIIKTLPGGMILGIVAIALGALLLIPTFSKSLQPIFYNLHIIVGVLLIVFGVLKIVGKQ